jgi:tetratricopeptide (TPR) repeat protein
MAYRQLRGLGVDATLTQQAHDLYASAQQAYNAGQYQQALDSFRRAYQAIANPIVLVAIAQSLERLGRRDEARAQFQAYLWADPAGPQASVARQGVTRLTPAPVAPEVFAPEVPSSVPPGPLPTTMPTPESPSFAPAPSDTNMTVVFALAGAGLVAVVGLGFWLSRKPRANRARRS